jgi:hypothetical protein
MRLRGDCKRVACRVCVICCMRCMVRRVCRQDSENMRNSEALANLKLALETFHAEQSAAADAQHALLQRELAAANVRKPTLPKAPNPFWGPKARPNRPLAGALLLRNRAKRRRSPPRPPPSVDADGCCRAAVRTLLGSLNLHRSLCVRHCAARRRMRTLGCRRSSRRRRHIRRVPMTPRRTRRCAPMRPCYMVCR